LKKVETPDEIELMQPERCSCGQDLENEKCEIIETRQVFDIPRIKMQVKEYRLAQCICPQCFRENRGTFPTRVQAPTQYGPRIKGLAVLLNTDYKVPLKKITLLLQDLFGAQMNEATIVNTAKKAYELLGSTEEYIKTELLKGKIIHADETGIAAGDKLHWVHVNSTRQYTYKYVHTKRGIDGIADPDNSVLHKYRGRVIHDCWASYWKLELANHGTCNAHIIRELNDQIEDGKIWALKMHELLMTLYESTVYKNKKDKRKIYSKYARIINAGEKTEPKPKKSRKRGRVKRSKGLNLIHRLRDYRDEVLAFAFDKDVPFTNNQGERDLRELKTKLKVSGCFRSVEGAIRYARITSFTSTLRKNSLNVLNSLADVFRLGSFQMDLT